MAPRARSHGKRETPSDAVPIVVGIGASAGGLEAFTQLLGSLPTDTGMAFVLVQHLDPLHESALRSLLGRATKLPVDDAVEGAVVRPDHVYVIPPNTDLRIVRGILRLKPRNQSRSPHRGIDSFFESLAEDRRERAIGVVLSGTATDGTLGLEAIKAEGGITFAQDDSAKYDSMPRSAAAAGCVDAVLPPQEIAKELARIAKHPYVAGDPFGLSNRSEEEREPAAVDDDGTTPAFDEEASLIGARPKRGVAPSRRREKPPASRDSPQRRGFAKILQLLRNRTGVDFDLYRATTIRRRVARRLILNRLDTLEEYAALLRRNAKELDALYSDVLIGVTGFFRNPEAFKALQRDVLPQILGRRADGPVRVWVLGCSTGQEAYSIAMAFTEAADKTPRARELQVFATDLNEASLEKARRGLYAKSLAEDIAPERIRRFFVEHDGGYRICKSLRESTVFARQDLLADPPFSRIDLICCRNLLIYLEPALQKKVMSALHYALKPGGFLFLGASESVGSSTDLFETFDKTHKIFVKKPVQAQVVRVPATTGTTGNAAAKRGIADLGKAPGLAAGTTAEREADRILAGRYAPPGVLVDDALRVLQFRGPVGAFLEPPLGKASFDLLKMAREGLKFPLRRAVDRGRKANKSVRVANVTFEVGDTTRSVDIEVIPLRSRPDRRFLIVFHEMRAPDATVESSRRRTAPAKAPKHKDSTRASRLRSELAETRAYLQSVEEQHEAANEELQSANEEVQSANEELQSINEELETSKEELESANEELTTVNDEMTSRNAELTRLHDDLVNLQTATKIPVVLLGRDLTIRRFSPPAGRQFDLTATDVGMPFDRGGNRLFLDASIEGGATLDLQALVSEVIASVREQEREVRDAAGRWHSLRLRPYLTLDNRVDGAVMVLFDIDAIKRSEQAVTAARDYAQNIIDTVREPLFVLDGDLRIENANISFFRHFQTTPSETRGRHIRDFGAGWSVPRLHELLKGVFADDSTIEDFEFAHDDERFGPRRLVLNARRIRDPRQETTKILAALVDVTDSRTLEITLRDSENRFRRLFEAAKDGILLLDAQTWTVLDANVFVADLLGVDSGDLPGMDLCDTGLLGDEATCRRAVDELQRAGYLRLEQQSVRNRRGEDIVVELIASVYQEERGQVAQANVRDVTRRTALEKTVAEQAEIIVRESRHKDEFLAMLSHELRNPLAPIRLAIQVLKSNVRSDDDARFREALAIVDRQTANLTRLVDELLDVSRVLGGRLGLELRIMDLREIVRRAAETSGPIIEERDHRFTANVEGEAVWVEADATRLEQVFVNLLNNAARYTSRGGEVAIAVEPRPTAGVVRVRVRDNGPGISEKIRPWIFDLFTQAHQSRARTDGGLGVGLALVRRLTELHGGAVEILCPAPESAVGSEFVVELPLAPGPPSPDAVGTDEARNITHGLRILVVDDSVDQATMLAAILRHRGYGVQCAYTGPDGLSLALQWRPDVVLLDIGLPIIDGYEVARRIRAAEGKRSGTPDKARTRLVAITGYGRPSDVAAAREAGFDAHLVKPCDLDKLMAILDVTDP